MPLYQSLGTHECSVVLGAEDDAEGVFAFRQFAQGDDGLVGRGDFLVAGVDVGMADRLA